MPANPLLELRELGQSVWLDDLNRGMLDDGSLARLIEDDGVSGLTSNPAILSAAIMQRPEYAPSVRTILAGRADPGHAYEQLVLEDVVRAADVLRPVYERTAGRDGFVSVEVSPRLAADTAGTGREARRLWQELARPNVMIKIPGTVAGLPAIRDSIAAGINVNVTLLFSPERYVSVGEAYRAGLAERRARGEPLGHVTSVASFFVSRIDSLVDRRLDDLARRGQTAARALRGKAALAAASRAYESYCEALATGEWDVLAGAGARPQRLLWASTSAKDPAYSPIKYVEELVAFDTVTTLPPETLAAYRRSGRPELRLERGLADASDAREALGHLGIDMEEVATQLEEAGIRKFAEPLDRLQCWLAERASGF